MRLRAFQYEVISIHIFDYGVLKSIRSIPGTKTLKIPFLKSLSFRMNEKPFTYLALQHQGISKNVLSFDLRLLYEKPFTFRPSSLSCMTM
jgi:hypothetical protein